MKALRFADATFNKVTIRGQEFLFTEDRIERNTVPGDLYVYYVKHGDRDRDRFEPIEIRSRAPAVNFYGTIVGAQPIRQWDDSYDGASHIYIQYDSTPGWYDENKKPHYFPSPGEWELDIES